MPFLERTPDLSVWGCVCRMRTWVDAATPEPDARARLSFVAPRHHDRHRQYLQIALKSIPELTHTIQIIQDCRTNLKIMDLTLLDANS